MTDSEPDVVTTGPPGEPSRLGFALRILGGCVVVAMVVGIGWWAKEAGDDDFFLPDKLLGLDASDSESDSNDIDAEHAELIQEDIEGRSKQLSDAYDGAEVVWRVYATDDGDHSLSVWALRAEADPLVAQVNPDWVPESIPSQELVEHGDVSCLVTTKPNGAVMDGVSCQRSAHDLTVQVSAWGFDSEEIVETINDLWEDLS